MALPRALTTSEKLDNSVLTKTFPVPCRVQIGGRRSATRKTLITVGAVDISLEPAGFTAFGESVDLYSNGFEVPARGQVVG